jgi:hypothetical protein
LRKERVFHEWLDRRLSISNDRLVLHLGEEGMCNVQ